MLVNADQLVCHVVGDYVLQSDWMAEQKIKRVAVALVHATTYALPFLFLGPSVLAFAFIVGTHAVIDRYRLARYLVWAKNLLAPPGYNHPWAECVATGYHSARPPWLTTWLLIIADNAMHVVLNGVALRWL